MNQSLKIVLFVVAAAFAGLMGMSISSSFAATHPEYTVFIIIGGLLVFVGIIVWGLSGNKRTRKADAATRAQALQLTPPPGKAAIYLVRKGWVGRAQGINLTIDGVATGQVKGNQFVYAEVDPGSYHVSAKARGSNGQADVQVGEGEAAVLCVSIEMGMLSGSIALTPLPTRTRVGELTSAKMVLWNE